MIRLLVFIAVLVVLALGFGWLADNPGEVTLVWFGRHLETDTTVLVVAVLAALALTIALFVVVRWLVCMPGSIFGWFGRRRRERGLAALSRGLIAVGVGDAKTATKATEEATWILGDEPMALLLQAQAAQLIEDRGSAERAYRTMLDNPQTKLLGLRGLYVEAVRWGDGEAAARHAEEANRLAPKLAWAGTALADHRAQTHDWQGALETIDRNRRHGVVGSAAAKRLRAVVLTADGLERETTAADIVRGTALEAHGLAPSLVPAACLAARLVSRNGDLRKAARILETTWKIEPHPDLADAYAGLRSGDSAQDRLARIRDLVKLRANHPEGQLALARAAIDAKDFATARDALKPLLVETPTRRVCLAMAALEDGEHGDAAAARAWLTRAVHAPRDRAWVADGFVSEHWAALSPISGRLDAFEWKVPPEDAFGPVGDPIEVIAATKTAGALVVETAASPGLKASEVVIDGDAKPVTDAQIQVRQGTVEAATDAGAKDEGPTPGITVPTAKANGAKSPEVPHLPDDPGPDDGPEQPKPKRFRFFS